MSMDANVADRDDSPDLSRTLAIALPAAPCILPGGPTQQGNLSIVSPHGRRADLPLRCRQPDGRKPTARRAQAGPKPAANVCGGGRAGDVAPP
ncbi:hypothetical protein PUN4_10124 [Paraburkholderia unamae]|nr:hypothetical protein PUN4_10124 [Paraburkholderia unamae]